MKMAKYNESLIRDLAAEEPGRDEQSRPSFRRKCGCYLTGVLMQAKIENSPKQLDRLKHGILRLLGIKAQPRRETHTA